MFVQPVFAFVRLLSKECRFNMLLPKLPCTNIHLRLNACLLTWNDFWATPTTLMFTTHSVVRRHVVFTKPAVAVIRAACTNIFYSQE